MTKTSDCSQPLVNVILEVPPPRRGLLRRMLSVWLERWWWLVVLPLLITIGLALAIDPRWWYVTMMVALMIYPTMILVVYSRYGTEPGAALATCRKEVTIDDSIITIDYYGMCAPEEGNEEESEISFDKLRGHKEIAIWQITSWTIDAQKITVEWGRGVWDYVELPLEQFGDEATVTSVAKRLIDARYAKRYGR